MAWTYEQKEKRLSKLSPNERIDLMFDLINAFGMVKNSKGAALLLQDLLTAKEIENLSKRLRIAKLLLESKSHREIADKLHCSFGTIGKVHLWLKQGGEGFQKVIVNLPKKVKASKLKPIPIEFQGPQALVKMVEYAIERKQTGKVKKTLEKIEDKRYADKKYQESISDLYKRQK